ncbi:MULTISPECIES: MBL fold metallo-hydrolase [Clostridium]|uniref:MBL fold metallo-hydrolase n=1 Tax=Clostridium frigoriphilum TaxID=443253 RepID=A0ABU7UM39_9CLOT|nr:MBL fold metallo-hydrolase [Clostridium sp. DSM 17811]MBU3100062.1 MBL fold metallo-hydrolase [Clostridium sp. DSM 17811]
MKIQLLGNCTILLSSKNSQILFDPYFNNFGNLLYKRTTNVSNYYKDIKHLDAILLSHDHFDHMDIKFLSKFKDKCSIYAPKWSLKPLIFRSKPVWIGDKFVVGDFSITVVRANHICPAVGYIIKSEDLTLYFAGDTYYGKFMKDISEKYTINIAMLPITHYLPPMTMGERGALLCLRELNPRFLIPMHQDIIQRFQFANSTIAINELNDKIRSKKLSTKLIHLNNGEIFNINSNEIENKKAISTFKRLE